MLANDANRKILEARRNSTLSLASSPSSTVFSLSSRLEGGCARRHLAAERNVTGREPR
jgi:hypothetical protein